MRPVHEQSQGPHYPGHALSAELHAAVVRGEQARRGDRSGRRPGGDRQAAAGAAGANAAGGAPQQRQRTSYQEPGLETVGLEIDKILKYRPQEGFSHPLDKRQKVLASGDFNISGRNSNLATEAKSQLDKAKTMPKGNKRSMLEAKAYVSDAIGRAQVLIANNGYSPDKALYKTSANLAKGIRTMAGIAYDDQTQGFVRQVIKDVETFSPSAAKYYNKDFLKAKDLCREEVKDQMAA